MQQQIDTTCQTLHASIDTFERQACHTPQHARCDKTHAFTHTHTHACECRRDIDHRDNPCQETSTVGEGYYFGGPQKTRENSHIVFYVALLQRHILHFYSAPPQKAKQHKEHCTFTALCNASHCASLD